MPSSAGAAARLRLTVDRPGIEADGQDLAFVTVEAVDAEGRLQPNAQDEVSFALTGPGALAAVANGDATSDEPYVGSSRHLFRGRALVVVRAAEAAGSVTVEATAPGLGGAKVKITTRAVSVPASLR